MKQTRILLLLLIVLAAATAFVCVRCGKDRQEQSHTSVLTDLPLNHYEKEKFASDNGRITYGDAMTGIDVSSHQENIDWQRVKADGIDFAIIRCAYRGYTNGGISMDPCFLQNLQGAKDAGLQVGVYLFSQAITAAEAEEEADFLLECLDGAKLDLPVFYDWEPIEDKSRTQHTTGREVTDFALAFCRRVEQAGYSAGVYFNESMGYAFFRLPKLKEYPFWLAQYVSVPDFYYDFTFWQYTSQGTVDGIDTPVDLNLLLK